jgi:hypothetical protein
MTRRRALEIVLDAALRQCEGSGVGMRHMPGDGEKKRIVDAARKLWGEVHAFSLDGCLDNYGLSRFAAGRAPRGWRATPHQGEGDARCLTRSS